MGIEFGKTELSIAIDGYELDQGRRLTRDERNAFAAGWYAGRGALRTGK